MAKMSGFFCQDDYLPKLSKLTDSEVGVLIRALMKYHADGEVAELDGKVSIAFDFIRDDIDQQEEAYRRKCEQASENRRKGLEQKKTDDNARQRPSTSDNGRDKYNNNKNINEHNITESFMDDSEAAGIQHEHDRIFTAAEDAGFKMSNTVRASLIHLYSEYGLDKMMAGFIECANHGAVNLAYLQAVLKGSPKKVKAQEYEQRDYQSVQNELLARQNERILRRLQEAKEA